MPDLDELTRQVHAARAGIERELGAAREVGRRGMEARQELAGLRELHAQHERVAALLTRIGEERQESAQRQIEELVTRALQVIFGEELSFHVVQSVSGSQPQVDFVIRSSYVTAEDDQPTDTPVVVETPVLEARGGGMAVVVAFLLRLVVLLLIPGARRVLFLDESFAHVSAGYEPRVAEFLREVCDKAGVQVVMITHSDAYADAADCRYELTLGPDGVTTGKRL